MTKYGKIATGTIQNIEGNTYLVHLGKIEAFLPPHEQVRGESFNVNDRIRVYIVDIQKTLVGQSLEYHVRYTGLVKATIHIRSPRNSGQHYQRNYQYIHEPGKRSKVAVKSNNSINRASWNMCWAYGWSNTSHFKRTKQ